MTEARVNTAARVRLTEHQRAELDRLAALEDRPVSWLIRQAVDAYLSAKLPAADDGLETAAEIADSLL